MKNKFDETYKHIMHLISEDAGFDFISYSTDGPGGMIKVKKAGAYACPESGENLAGAESKEGKYSADYLKGSNFVCTADVSTEAGEFWIVKGEKFGKNYDVENPDKSKTVTKKYNGKEMTFIWYPALDKRFECFKLPTNMKPTTWKGNKFNPGNYVFINDAGECDEWERTADFMQQQYEKIGEGKKPAEDSIIYKQYNEIIDGKNS